MSQAFRIREIEYIDVLPAMNRQLRLWPPNTKLETISGV
jgi:hypothetical protein